MRGTRSPEVSVLALSMPPDARHIPEVRLALRRWLVRHHLDARHSVVELLASELLARAVIHARSDISISARAEEGAVRVEVDADMAPEPLRLVTVATLAGRRREALLAALSRAHGAETHAGIETSWFEVPERQHGLS